MLKQLSQGSGKVVMTPDEMVQAEPLLLAVKDQLYGGIWNSVGTNGNMYEFACQLKEILIHKYNVKFVFNEEVHQFLVSSPKENDTEKGHVTGLVTKTGTSISGIAHLIVANGNDMMQLMKTLGIYMPIYPVKVKRETRHCL